MENFVTFQHQVRDGLKNLKSQDVRYDHIEALMVYWKGGDVPEVAEKAKALGKLLNNEPYNFTVIPHEIDYKRLAQHEIDDNFRDALRDIEVRLRTPNIETSSLLILYYGGHGFVDGADRLWKPTKSSQKRLFWSNCQSSMYFLNCDILYLFDCCCSLAMVETPETKLHHRRRCEILCSSGLKQEGGALNKIMFTNALVELLENKKDDILDRKAAIGGLTFSDICTIMTRQDIRNTLLAEPRWQVVAPNPAFRGKITLAKKRLGIDTITPQPRGDDSDSGYKSQIESYSQLSDTRILIKIRLTNPAEGLSSNDWLKWFEDRPHNVAHIDIAVLKKIEWVGIFGADSSLALITVPMWLWQNMEQDPACESLGIVRSNNLLRRPPDEIPSGLSVNLDAAADKTKEREQGISLRNLPFNPLGIAKSAKPAPVKGPIKRQTGTRSHLHNTTEPTIQPSTTTFITRPRGKQLVTARISSLNDDYMHKQLASWLPDKDTSRVVGRTIRPLR
ncbi:hypothetical protein JMJ35_008892 [Cladonia borealis]|uniref:Uncharacterized protein n=1 Tax=Cladonia borealis TaxID=184061 RepID=A0AA39U664_9LECA|nr:hypothetical protein JMJ35_008892 [Cladonia borealis]